ncbi:MAG: DUF2079 domain-containing protein [Armatimonadota bacterium]|nr:DUF2079 domain-containing protein [Armatimonadota bacterium]
MKVLVWQKINKIVLSAIILSFTIILLLLQLRRFNLLGALAFDMGIYQQAVWQMAHGEPLFNTIRGTHFFGDHFRPVMFLFAPFYRLWSHPFWLFLGQTLALALGALPLYRIALRHTQKPWVANLVVVGYLLHPASFTMLIFDFHSILLAIPFLLWAIDAADEGRPFLFFISSFMALTCKENVAVAVASVSLFAILFRQRWWGILGLLMSALWFWIAMELVAKFGGVEYSPYLALYQRWGETPMDILWSLLRQPFLALQALILCSGHTTAPGVYPLLLLVPFGFLPLLAPDVLAFALPGYALIALSERPIMRDLGYWHGSLVLPWLVVASAFAWGRLLRWGQEFSLQSQNHWHKLLALNWLTCLFFSTWYYGLPTINRFSYNTLPAERAQSIQRLLNELITPDASVSATSTLVPLLAHRREIYLFPNPFQPFMWGASKEALEEQMGRKEITPLSPEQMAYRLKQSRVDFILLMPKTHLGPLKEADYETLVVGVLSCPEYGVIAVQDGIIVLRRGADFLLGLRRLGVLDVTELSELPQSLSKILRDRWQQLVRETL